MPIPRPRSRSHHRMRRRALSRRLHRRCLVRGPLRVQNTISARGWGLSASSPRRSPQPQRAAGARHRPRPAVRTGRTAARRRRRVGSPVVEQRAGRRRSGRVVHQRPRRSRLERLDRRRLDQRAAAERLRARRRSVAAGGKLSAHPPQRRHGADGEQRQRRRRPPHRHRRAGPAPRDRFLLIGIAATRSIFRALDDPKESPPRRRAASVRVHTVSARVCFALRGNASSIRTDATFTSPTTAATSPTAWSTRPARCRR